MLASKFGSSAYWSVYAVVDQDFTSREKSLDHFYWRSAQYVNYLELMPVKGFKDSVILDYGCGPGNDIIGFIEHSRPKKIIGADVSRPSIEMAKKRVDLHNYEAQFVQLDEANPIISLPSNSIDYIHSSGVLHHVQRLNPTIKELYRVLKPGGQLRAMVYNYNSIWLHLNTAYLERLKIRKFGAGMSLDEIFKTTTDGKECPISRVYKPNEFLNMFCEAGFSGTYLGAAISMHELKILDRRFDAILDMRLEREHREFLLELDFDSRGIPHYQDNVAGIDACFLFTKT